MWDPGGGGQMNVKWQGQTHLLGSREPNLGCWANQMGYNDLIPLSTGSAYSVTETRKMLATSS